ncbi:MAG: hypothetical protein M1812_000565 [Candelaria pacifica]|nr:MAG: hypothetical protein M1812_000565 [Candelaria pacifica]
MIAIKRLYIKKFMTPKWFLVQVRPDDWVTSWVEEDLNLPVRTSSSGKILLDVEDEDRTLREDV